MTNIYAFALQTLTVSVVAIFLLVLKWLLKDKLPPKWQYAIWLLLAIRILLPVSTSRYVLVELSLWIENLKYTIERSIISNYISAFQPLQIQHILPVITKQPISITDLLFVVYTIGILVFFLRYLYSYFQIRKIVKESQPVSDTCYQKIQAQAKALSIPTIQVVQNPHLPSAFVFGVFHPVLVLPNEEMDHKIILHELLHIQHKDVLHNMLWSLLRCFHWCNPFIHYVCHIISNDIESMCDQSVLEHLEGEQRREYGTILLQMANQQYPNAFGTSSISNGGKNISKRIENIARFKKYPKGMLLVSICIGIVLCQPTLIGASYTYNTDTYLPNTDTQFQELVSLTRIHRCTTLAGAIDTYAKGLLLKNVLYLLTASPIDKQEELLQRLDENPLTFDSYDGGDFYYIYLGEDLAKFTTNDTYGVYDIKEIDTNSYEIMLVLTHTDQETEENSYSLFIPLSIYQENGWFVAEEIGTHEWIDGITWTNDFYTSSSTIWPIETLEAQGNSGTFFLHHKTKYTVDTYVTQNSFFSSTTTLDITPKLDATFENVWYYSTIQYNYTLEEKPENHLTLYYAISKQEDPLIDLSQIYATTGQETSTTCSDGWGYYNWIASRIRDYEYEYGFMFRINNQNYLPLNNNNTVDTPMKCQIMVIKDGVVIDELVIERK